MNNISNFIMCKTVFPVAFGLGMLWYILKKGTQNTKQEDQEKANTSVKKICPRARQFTG